MSESPITAKIIDGGASVEIATRHQSITLSAQDAYDLSEAITALLPGLIQPFEPYPREEEAG